jgi:hypothetical protein
MAWFVGVKLTKLCGDDYPVIFWSLNKTFSVCSVMFWSIEWVKYLVLRENHFLVWDSLKFSCLFRNFLVPRCELWSRLNCYWLITKIFLFVQECPGPERVLIFPGMRLTINWLIMKIFLFIQGCPGPERVNQCCVRTIPWYGTDHWLINH